MPHSSTWYPVGGTINNKKAKQLSCSQIQEVSRLSGGALPPIGITPNRSVQEDRHSAPSLWQRSDAQQAGGNMKKTKQQKPSNKQATARTATSRRGSHQKQTASRLTWCLQRPSAQLAPSPRLAKLAQAHYVWNAEVG